MPDPTRNSYICCMMHLIKILKMKKHLQILFTSEKIEYIYSKVGGRYVGNCYLCFFACESMSLFFIVSFIQLLWADTMFQSPLSELERKKGKVNFFGQSLLLALTRALYAILLQFRRGPPFFSFLLSSSVRPVTLDHYHSIFFILCNTNYSHSIPSNMMHYHY